MKIRTYITLILIIIYFSIAGFFNFFHDPLVGAANAQQATDTITGYSISRFMSEGYFNFYLNLLVFGFLVITWLPFLFLSKKEKN